MNTIVDIVKWDLGHNRLSIEGRAKILDRSGRPNYYWVKFLDGGEVRERFVDPVVQLMGAASYVDAVNSILTERAETKVADLPRASVCTPDRAPANALQHWH